MSQGTDKIFLKLHNKLILSRLSHSAFLHIYLYVLKDFHGAGVANNLMDFAIQFATENGFEKLYLSVWEYNFRARGFYEKHGFINSRIENDFPLGSTPQTDLWFVKSLIPKS